MDRSGELVTFCDGKQFGKKVWCDRRGTYEAGDLAGTSEFFFYKDKLCEGGTQMYIKCKEKYTIGVNCPVRGKITTGGAIVYIKGTHNHLPELQGHGLAVRTVRASWLQQLRDNPRLAPMSSILDKRRLLPTEAAVQIVPVEHIHTARRHCAEVRPAAVRNIGELHEKIGTQDIPGITRTLDGERIISFLLPHNSLLITTRRQLELLRTVTMLQADATYKIVPRGFGKQLFTLHGHWRSAQGSFVGMIGFALMESATTLAYQEIFRALKRELPGISIPAYMGDFDKAMRKAVRSEFPDIRVYGCLFHHAQALVKKASEPDIGLARDIRSPGDVLKKFLAFAALPLLPAGDIVQVFHLCAAEALAVDTRFSSFVEYYRREWLGVVGVASLSLFRAPCRTNNAVESSNAFLKRELKCHGSIRDFMSVLCGVCQDTAIDHGCHQNGKRHIRSKPNRATKVNEEKIQVSWDRLDAGLITAKMFVDRVKYRAGGSAVSHGLSEEGETDAALDVWELWVDGQAFVFGQEGNLPVIGDHPYHGIQILDPNEYFLIEALP